MKQQWEFIFENTKYVWMANLIWKICRENKTQNKVLIVVAIKKKSSGK